MNRHVSCASVLFVTALLASNLWAAPRTDNLPMVRDLDLKSFSGTWYEIARLPNRHQRGMVEVTQQIAVGKRGNIAILTKGYKGSRKGRLTAVKGTAKVPDRNNKGALKVKVYGFINVDYRVLAVDRTNYDYALVTSGTMDYLWVICRKPVMKERSYQKLLEKAEELGFRTAQLERVDQSANTAMAGSIKPSAR